MTMIVQINYKQISVMSYQSSKKIIFLFISHIEYLNISFIIYPIITLKEMFEILALLLFILISCMSIWFVYLHWIRPRMVIKWYTSTLQSLGYKVITLPYRPFKISLSEIQKYNQQEHGDAFYDEKNQWPKYDIVVANTGNIVTLILLKPQLLRSFYSTDKQPLFPKTIDNKIVFNLLLKNSLILNSDEEWRRKRKLFTDIMNFQFVKRNIPKMIEICSRMIQKMEKEAKINNVDEERFFRVSLLKYFEEMMGEIVIKLFFGADKVDLDIDGVSFNQYMFEIFDQARLHTNDWTVWVFGEKAYRWSLAPKYKKLYSKVNRLKEQVRTLLKEKLQRSAEKGGKVYSNLFEALYYLKKQQGGEKDVIDVEQFISQFCAFMLASNSTTANYVNMVLYYLSENSETFAKLQKIIRETIRSPQQMNYSNLKNVEYLDWCQQQTTRMYGPTTGILLRQAKADTYLDNIPVLKGTGFKIELLASHYNQKIYKQPFKFDPSRWQLHEGDPFAFGGFGYGAHSCIGKSLALLATKMITSLLLLRYDSIKIAKSSEIRLIYRGVYRPTQFESILGRPRKVERENKSRDDDYLKEL